jgi:hypothetical protein
MQGNLLTKNNAMNRLLVFLPTLIASMPVLAQTNPKATTTNAVIAAMFKAIPVNELIKWRRHIHENAEVSFKEENTSKYVEGILKGLECDS